MSPTGSTATFPISCCSASIPRGSTSELRWEPSADAFAGEFPHVYGPIAVDAVIEVFPWGAGEHGFALPDAVHDLLDG